MDNFDLKKYLAEGRLFEEDFKNPILDKYLELKKSIDYKTVFPTDLYDFVDSLDNTEREGLESDLGLERDELYEGKLLKEGIPQESEIADYVEAMFNDSVVEKEGFQSDIWTKAEYAATSRGEGSVFMDLAKHLNSVGGKDVLEGNPDIHLELLSNGDIQWSADVT
jgi:hypothetical protein